MAEETTVIEGSDKPFITIDDVQVFVEDLPQEGQQVFGRLQRLNQKKVDAVLDLEELQAGINYFSSKIVEIYSADAPEQPTDSESTEKES
tara:strand:- start:64 stop:333 length:270 start_codon:yes stop_codon:yes gene_type:complete